MNFLCVKYSGLKFNYIFETNDFIFIPKDLMEGRNLNMVMIDEFFSCRYDESAQFFVLCKKIIDINTTIEDITDDMLFKFRLLESIIGLLFSNRLIEDSIIIFKKENERYETLKIFKNIYREKYEINPILIWKNYILTVRLKDILNDAFSMIESISDPKAFLLKYFFCIDMYLKGKYSDQILTTISHLWISLEVLATITIIHVLKSDKNLFPPNYVDNIKGVVESCAMQIPEDEITCWDKLKEGFVNHIKNKINTLLPIGQKVVKIAEEYLNIQDIRSPFKSPEDFNHPEEYITYMEKIRDFKHFQDNLTLKKIVNNFSDYRNALFHGGGLPDMDGIFERQKNYFCLLIERLFFKVLRLNLVKFHKWGYFKQYLWTDIGTVEASDYFSNYTHYSINYILETYMRPLNPEFRLSYEEMRDQVINNFYNNREDLFFLIDELNQKIDRINTILREHIELSFINNETALNVEFELERIKGRELSFIISSEPSVFSQLFTAFMEKKECMVENTIDEDILIRFKGFIEYAEYKNRTETQLEFIIKPEYISFDIIRR